MRKKYDKNWQKAKSANNMFLLSRHAAPLKKYGQNFLTSPAIAHKIVDAAELGPQNTVLEIGPGKGVLTRLMAEQCRKVWAVEIDSRWAQKLAEDFPDSDRVAIVNRDILQYDLSEIKDLVSGYKVVANLPYNIAVPILEKLLTARYNADSLVVMVQKEMADRIAAKPGSKDYGSLSLFIQYHAKVEKLFHVPPGSFFPRPKVTSSVIRLVPYPKPPVKVDDEDAFFGFVRTCFSQRRKMLRAVLKQRHKWPDDLLSEISAVDLSRRAETLDLNEFTILYKVLSQRQ